MDSRKEAKKRLLAKAEELIDELLHWDEETARPTLTDIEDIVLRLRQELGQEMAEMVISRQEDRRVPGPSCAVCGKEMEYKGQKRNGVESRAGMLQTKRGHYRCPQCGEGIFPLDQQLGLRDPNWSEGVAQWAVRLCGLLPFGQAAVILTELAQITISPSTVWRLTGKWMEKMEAAQQVEVATAQALPCTLREEGQQAESHKRMGVSMDGTMIHIRGEGWKEAKVGCVYKVGTRQETDPVTQEAEEMGCAIHSSYAAYLGGPAVFGQTLWAEARQRGWATAAESQVIGDGAPWIWNLADEHFYTSHRTIDFYHAVEHLADIDRLLHQEGTTTYERWLTRQKTRLYHGEIEQLISSVEREAERHPKLAKELRSKTGYFKRNNRRMNYLQMRNEGWLIGSGVVESGGKQLKARLAGPGMRWSRRGADHLMLLRTHIMSDRFHDAWNSAYYHSPLN